MSIPGAVGGQTMDALATAGPPCLQAAAFREILGYYPDVRDSARVCAPVAPASLAIWRSEMGLERFIKEPVGVHDGEVAPGDACLLLASA